MTRTIVITDQDIHNMYRMLTKHGVSFIGDFQDIRNALVEIVINVIHRSEEVSYEKAKAIESAQVKEDVH